MSQRWKVYAFALCVLTHSSAARAWLFHEHTSIGRTAIHWLPEDDTATLAKAWEEARSGAPRLCAAFGKPDKEYVLGPRREPDESTFCADFAMIPAVAGDFSCAPDDLWDNVTKSEWLPKIAAAAHRAEVRIVDANRADKDRVAEAVLEAWRDNHLKNFEHDPGYLQRARGNIAHFLWPRRSDDLDAYLTDAFTPGRAPNASAFYAVYHIAAVRFARRAALMKPDQAKERRDALRWMFFSEATALHYLQDGFSAGHAVGRAGDSRDRTGTHDYYCEHGVEGRIWPTGRGEGSEPDTDVAYGDAIMKREDQRHAADAVRMSLRDLAHVLADGRSYREIVTSDDFAPAERVKQDTMDACVESTPENPTLDTVPRWLKAAKNDPWIWSVLRLSMMPALATDRDPEPHTTAPVFPTEAGFFIGAFAAGRMGAEVGIGAHEGKVRFPVSGEGGIQIGFGVPGLATSQTDAMLLVSVGPVLQSAELDAPLVGEDLVPARLGFSLRFRVPFRYIPGLELFYTLPAMLLGSNYARGWVVRAAEAGFFGIERQWSTPIGSFQIIALREVAVRYLTTSDGTDAAANLEFPLLEMKPRPWYGASTGNAFTIQLGLATDFGPTTSSIGGFLRVGLNTRRYLPLTL
jgi:hypothetical protein